MRPPPKVWIGHPVRVTYYLIDKGLIPASEDGKWALYHNGKYQTYNNIETAKAVRQYIMYGEEDDG